MIGQIVVFSVCIVAGLSICFQFGYPFWVGLLGGSVSAGFLYKPKEILSGIKYALSEGLRWNNVKRWWDRWLLKHYELERIFRVICFISAIASAISAAFVLALLLIHLLLESGSYEHVTVSWSGVFEAFIFFDIITHALALCLWGISELSPNTRLESLDEFDDVGGLWVWNPVIGPFALWIVVFWWILKTIGRVMYYFAEHVDTNKRRSTIVLTAIGITVGYPFGDTVIGGIVGITISVIILALSHVTVNHIPEPEYC